jgi:hypothetical protein
MPTRANTNPTRFSEIHPFPYNQRITCTPNLIYRLIWTALILSRPCGTGPSLSPTPRTTPDFLHATLDRSAYAAFFTESRTRQLDSIKLHRKSGYRPGLLSATLSRPFGTCSATS